MKLLKKLAFICLAGGALMLAPGFAFAQGNIVELGAGLAGLPSDVFIAWSAGSLPDADPGNGFLFDDIEATLPSGTFTFDLAITSSSATPLALRSNIFIGSDGDTALSDGEVLTLTVSDVTNDFVFDGFTNIGSADIGNNAGEGFIFGNQTFIRGTATNGDDDPRNGVVLDAPSILPGPSTTFESVGTVALRGVLLQFTSSVSLVLLGDVNQDGFVNFSDIGPFIGLLSTQEFQIEGDVNQDGVVDFSDISPFIEILIAN